MNIELLWIIPILSFMVFIFLVIYFSQKKDFQTDMSREVTNFNNGNLPRSALKTKIPVNRLEELEKSITTITDSIASQQKMIIKYKRENTEYNSEINELKSKLRELYKEYDIVLSENYSLRAKMKKIMEKKSFHDTDDEDLNVSNDIDENDKTKDTDKPKKVNLKLYEDTRLLNITNLEDLEDLRANSSK